MLSQSIRIIFIATVVLTGSICISAQGADNKSSIIGKPDENGDRPKSFKETVERLRIENEKKEYAQMIERGEEALKISEDLEKAYEQNGRLTERELAKVATVEKLVKKIRGELGGDDDEGNEDKRIALDDPVTSAEILKSFRATTVKLFDELKKTTRFTISTAAIQASNAVLKIARFLRVKQ